MGKLKLIFGGLILTFSLNAQQGNCDVEPNKKAKKVYEKGLEQMRINPSEGVSLIKEALDIDPEYLEANFLLGDYYFDQVFRKTNAGMRDDLKNKMLDKAINYYKEVNRICPEFYGHVASYNLGVIYHRNNDLDQAYTQWKYYLENEKEKPADRKKVCEEYVMRIDIEKSLKSNPIAFNPSDVKGINTERDEFLPMLTPDNEKIYFTRRVPNAATESGDFEYLMEARLVTLDSFSSGIPVGGPFDDLKLILEGQEIIGKGGVTITPDNKHLFVTLVKSRSGGGINVDIYYSDWNNGTWTDLRSIGNNINDEDGNPTWEGQPTISSDGQMIIFASAREACYKRYDPVRADSIPSMDLFMIKRQGRGWSDPVNLGSTINTDRNEKTPFLHTDSKTLYFSSNGHPGMGDYDIFYSRQDEFGNWTKPKNLGYPINTEEAEVSFIVSLDGKLGYLASGVEGADDGEAYQIISFPIPVEARPQKVVMVKGQMKDSDGNAVKDGKIEIKNTKTGEKTEAYVDNSTGEYVAVMTVEQEVEEIEVNGEKKQIKKEDSEPTDFILTAKKEGAAFSSTVVTADPDEIDGAQKIRGREIEVDPVKTDKPYRINDITFATNSAELNKRTVMILDEFIEFMLANPKYKVMIQGHTDNVGDDQENMTLSHNRAKSVHDHLLNNDIDPSRLSYKGFGETKPIASNNTEEGRAKNRRTEFVLKK